MGLDLKAFATEHVCYEVEMLIGTSRMLRPEPRTVADNAMLESFLVHARLLDGFLTGAIPKPGDRFQDDIVACHYVSEWDRGTVLTLADRDLVNKLVAHITSERMNQQPVPVLALQDKIAAALKKFLNALPSDKQPWFERAARALSAEPVAAAAITSTTNSTGVLMMGRLQPSGDG